MGKVKTKVDDREKGRVEKADRLKRTVRQLEEAGMDKNEIEIVVKSLKEMISIGVLPIGYKCLRSEEEDLNISISVSPGRKKKTLEDHASSSQATTTTTLRLKKQVTGSSPCQPPPPLSSPTSSGTASSSPTSFATAASSPMSFGIAASSPTSSGITASSLPSSGIAAPPSCVSSAAGSSVTLDTGRENLVAHDKGVKAEVKAEGIRRANLATRVKVEAKPARESSPVSAATEATNLESASEVGVNAAMETSATDPSVVTEVIRGESTPNPGSGVRSPMKGKIGKPRKGAVGQEVKKRKPRRKTRKLRYGTLSNSPKVPKPMPRGLIITLGRYLRELPEELNTIMRKKDVTEKSRLLESLNDKGIGLLDGWKFRVTQGESSKEKEKLELFHIKLQEGLVKVQEKMFHYEALKKTQINDRRT